MVYEEDGKESNSLMNGSYVICVGVSLSIYLLAHRRLCEQKQNKNNKMSLM